MSAVLYSFRRCPYAMRGRMGLKASGVAYEHREILLRDKPQAMLDASPKGTVPVFITQDGTIIDESRDLLFWALSQNDPLGWLNFDAASLSLIEDNDGPFKYHLDRYKYASRYHDDAKRGTVDHSHRQSAETYIATLNDRLDRTEFLDGDTQTVIDIAIFPFIRQFSNVEPDWWATHDYPHIRAWLSRHLDSEIFKSVMVKHPLWSLEAP